MVYRQTFDKEEFDRKFLETVGEAEKEAKTGSPAIGLYVDETRVGDLRFLEKIFGRYSARKV